MTLGDNLRKAVGLPNLRRTAIIHYVTDEGNPAQWRVACTEKDDERSMRAHANKWFPSMVVKHVEFEED